MTIEEAVQTADTAFDTWSRTPYAARRAAIAALRRSIARHQDAIAQAISEETGKPLFEAMSQEVTAALEMLRFSERSYGKWLKIRSVRYLRPGFWSKTGTIGYEPLGVFAIIGPSNFPFSLVVMQTATVLLCGNTAVIKPSERCPRTAELIGRVIREAGIPDGVAAVVQGGPDTAAAIIVQPAVAKVVFTGSTAAGRSVAALCGAHGKPSILELGGEGTAIICDDADLRLAADGVYWSATYGGGRSCVGTRRVLVFDSVYDEFLSRLVRLRNGKNPLDPKPPRLAVIESSDPGPNQVEDDEHPAAADARLVLTRVSSESEAIEAVNSSPCGLSASVWTSSASRGRRIALGLRVGMVWINDASAGQPGFPWGGVRESGWGRLYAREALSELTNLKAVSHDHRRTSRPKFWWYPYSLKKLRLIRTINRWFYG